MSHIHQAETDADRSDIRELFREHPEWVTGRVNANFGTDLDVDAMLKEDMAHHMDVYFPPDGRTLLATEASGRRA